MCQLQGSLEFLTFIGNLHRSMIIYQMANVPLHSWLHVSLFMHNSQDCLTSGWDRREVAHPFYVNWPRAFLNIPFTGLSVLHWKLCPSKTFHLLLRFHMTAPPLCDTQMSKRWQDSRLSNPLLSRGSWQHQMLPVTWEITVTIATYKVQGQSELSANAAKAEFLSSCLNNL